MWDGKERGGRVGRRASLDQYSTHIASGGGGCRKQHLKLREKDGAQGRTTQTLKQAQVIFLPCFIHIYHPLPPPPGFVLNRTPFLPLCEMPSEGNCMLKEYLIVHLTKINILIVSILLTGNKHISRDILFYISIIFHKKGKNENCKWKAAKIWMENWTGIPEICHRASISSMCQGETQVRIQLLESAVSKCKMRHQVLTVGFLDT